MTATRGILLLGLGAAPLAAQPPDARVPSIDFRVGAGAAVASTNLLIDGNGTEVRLGPAGYLHVEAAPRVARVGARVIGVLGARIARGNVRIETPQGEWRAGSAWQGDLTVGSRLHLGDRAVLRGGVGVTWLRGPRDVAPFDASSASLLGELALAAHLRERLRADVTVQSYRLAPAEGDPGSVGRLLVGASYAP